jgi:hypothetical protein
MACTALMHKQVLDFERIITSRSRVRAQQVTRKDRLQDIKSLRIS